MRNGKLQFGTWADRSVLLALRERAWRERRSIGRVFNDAIIAYVTSPQSAEDMSRYPDKTLTWAATTEAGETEDAYREALRVACGGVWSYLTTAEKDALVLDCRLRSVTDMAAYCREIFANGGRLRDYAQAVQRAHDAASA